MYQRFGDVTLKNGERAELGVVMGPDTGEWGPLLRSLLGHKGGNWQWQIEQSLTQNHPGVESRFYILSKNARPFANIMCVENQGIGIFGHVYTAPEERRKGAADLIHARQMEDVRARGGRALYLGTDFDSHPYHLYARHGFAGVEPGSGYMFWFARGQAEFESDIFRAAPVRHEPLSFYHWPTLPALAMMKHPARVRIAGMNIINVRSTEGGSLPYLVAMSEAKTDCAQAWVAVSQTTNVPVAIACVKPDAFFGTQTDVADLFCAPGFESELPRLFLRLSIESGRTAICYDDGLWPEKAAALDACGFKRGAKLPRVLLSRGEVHDVALWHLERN